MKDYLFSSQADVDVFCKELLDKYKGGKMKKSKKQRYEDMISINFYPKEIEVLIDMLDGTIEEANERGCREDWEMAEKWKKNFNLILKNFNEKEEK